ncbi:MAG: hypothetical protein E6H91_16800 [Chloroflexi bacterium]|nr:MAG: hypothetical protein E6H91_16800 [Chloroflexota bacterium]
MAQLWFGNPQLHYEVWMRSRIGGIELGLHFEADSLTNARLFAEFKARDPAIRDDLDDDARIETWDKGWARIWEPVPLGTLDDEFLERLASRMTAYITVLEPILLDELPSDVAWSETRGRTAHRAPLERARSSAGRTRASASTRCRLARSPASWGHRARP